MSSSTRRKSAPAASLLADGQKPKIIDVVAESPSPDPGTPIATATKEEHERLQREHREWLAQMSKQTPAEAAEADALDEEGQAEVVHLPTPEERAQRAREEALAAYEAAIIEMAPDEPIYVVGIRPPRPQFAGLVLELGDIVPGAAYWPRLDSWVRAGVVQAKQLTKAAV